MFENFFQTSAQEISAILGHFLIEAAINQKRFENQGNHNDVLNVVSYKLSDDTSYFPNERT